MKIVQLDIAGFRSLKNVSWRPGNLNVIIGPNGSGKTNLLRMLELISASARGKLSDHITLIGGMNQLIWDGFPMELSYTLTFKGGWAEEQILNYKVIVVDLTMGAMDYSIIDENLSENDGGQLKIEVEKDKEALISTLKGRVHDGTGKNTVDVTVPFPNTETVFSSIDTLSKIVPWLGLSSLRYDRKQIEDWVIYQDLRTDINAPIRQAPVARLDQKVLPDGQNLISVLHTLYSSDRNFKQQVNSAMLAAFGNDFDELIFPPAADQRIQLRVRWKTLKREQSAADLSDGTLRFLFLVTVLANPNPPSLIAIDEPETGLHPSMLPIIAELAVAAAERTQVVFTTHSDQFLDAFRETGVTPTTTIARWEEGETTLTTLSEEDLAYWLKDYTLGKMFRSGELENLAA